MKRKLRNQEAALPFDAGVALSRLSGSHAKELPSPSQR